MKSSPKGRSKVLEIVKMEPFGVSIDARTSLVVLARRVDGSICGGLLCGVTRLGWKKRLVPRLYFSRALVNIGSERGKRM